MIRFRQLSLGSCLALAVLFLTACSGTRKPALGPNHVTQLSNGGESVPERSDLPATIVTTAPANVPPDTRAPAPPSVTPPATPRTNSIGGTAPPAPKPGVAPSPARPVEATRYVNATTLNVRQSAAANAPVLDQIDRGTKVAVTGHATGDDGQVWSRIEYHDGRRQQSGWVATNYLSASYSVPRDKPSPPVESRPETNPGPEEFGDFGSLHYAPVSKPSYEGNPRINVRAVYVSLNVLSSSRFDDILAMVDGTHLNALVIDYKDDVGWLLTKSATAARLNPAANEKAKYADISDLIKRLKARNIYLIARIVTFKDPIFARTHPEKAILDNRTGRIFKSGDGLSWASPHDPDFRAYNLGIAREAAAAGFNEIQFDYIRFPDVARRVDLNYRNPAGTSKAAAIQGFLLEARRELAPLKVYLAADVFGLVTTTRDDMRIGQYWEAVSNAVDYICPMMYPSHYANRSYGLPVPDQHPYELIERGLRDALRRNANMESPAQVRPWLQGFTATWVRGHILYTPAEIKAQIQAAADSGVKSYLIWHPSGKYNAAAYR